MLRQKQNEFLFWIIYPHVFEVTLEKNVVFAGDFNLFFGSKLDAKGAKPAIRKKKKKIQPYDLCDIWRTRSPVTSTFTFKQKYCTGCNQHKLNYIFISNSHQEFLNYTSILTSLSADHSPVHLSLLKENKHTKGNGFGKFRSSLIKDHINVPEIKHPAHTFLSSDISNMNAQLKWKLLNYEIRKFTIDYTKP